jgi:polyphosphate kinase
VLLVVRREREKLMRYVHLATGNYNPITSRQYTDIGILTANDEIGADATSLFNFLTGYSQPDSYNHLIVAPLSLREELIHLIRREVRNKKDGKDARIIIKLNSLTDLELIEELYSASQSGVDIDLIVRGICALRPGVKGLSPTITVRSIVGRFLEHSRIFYFANGGGDEEEVYIGSADWMSRNLDRRVEVILPIMDAEIARYMRYTVLDAYLKDNVNSRLLRSDGTYRKVPGSASNPFDSQLFFVGQQVES